MQTTKTGDGPASFKATCGKCGHIKVCTVYRAVAPLLANWEEDTEPFKAADLAAICREFLDTTLGANL